MGRGTLAPASPAVLSIWGAGGEKLTAGVHPGLGVGRADGGGETTTWLLGQAPASRSPRWACGPRDNLHIHRRALEWTVL